MLRTISVLAVLLCACASRIAPPSVVRFEPPARVLTLPMEPLRMQRKSLVDIVLMPQGEIIMGTTFVATLTPDGRILDPQHRERARIGSDGVVVLTHGAGRLEIDEAHAIVRTQFRAVRETEVDVSTYLSRFPRAIWQAVLLAFFIDVVLMATEGVAATRHDPT